MYEKSFLRAALFALRRIYAKFHEHSPQCLLYLGRMLRYARMQPAESSVRTGSGEGRNSHAAVCAGIYLQKNNR